MQILIVEDDDAIAKPLAAGLEREGFDVTRVATGEDALEAALPDLVLLDLRLPGMDGTEVCRRLGVSEQTFYRWKKQFAGMGVQELRELRSLRDENRKLKQVVADLTLDRHILQEIVRKKI